MKNKSLLNKFITCIVAGCMMAALWLLIGGGQTNPLFPKAIIFLLVWLSLLFAVVFFFVWQYRQKKNPVLDYNYYALLYAIIRFFIAMDIAIFGWKKFFHLQFVVPKVVSDQPMNQQTGEILTWFYFGHSYVFGCIIAVIQIVGSLLLLFRKTCLLGSIILFALMLNIALINIFYQMNGGALTQSVVISFGLLFLILSEYDRLFEFFFKSDLNIVSVSSIKLYTRNTLRFAAVLLPLLYILYFVYR